MGRAGGRDVVGRCRRARLAADASSPARALLSRRAIRRVPRIQSVNAGPSRAWNLVFLAAYALVRVFDPLLRWTWFSVGLGITSRVTVIGRRSGRQRSVLVGLIRLNRTWYIGH